MLDPNNIMNPDKIWEHCMSSTAFAELERFERDTEQCMKCGFCTYVCPVYQEEKIESGVARGKNELVKAAAQRRSGNEPRSGGSSL